jgi:hypothetical protein
VAELDTPTVHALAIEALGRPRAYADPTGIAAWDLLRDAPEDTLVQAFASIAPGPFQERLWEELDQRDHAAAVKAASTASSPVLRAKVTAEVDTLRATALSDPKASAAAQFAALTVWRPGPTDPPDILERLRSSPSPKVREKAWELTLDATNEACTARVGGVATADLAAATKVYRECPQQPVRMAAFQRVATLDKVAAAAMVRVVLEEPETVRTGIAAVRAANALERSDMLAETVRRTTIARDVRRVALDFLVKADDPAAAELVDEHGSYLGYKPLPGQAAPKGASGPATAAEP